MLFRSVGRIGYRSLVTSQRPGSWIPLCSQSTAAGNAKALQYESFGDPAKVLNAVAAPSVKSLGDKQVRVRVLFSTVDGSDVATIQGRVSGSSLPAVGGKQASGVVEAVGSSVRGLMPKQKVLLTRPNLGAWTQELVCDASDVAKVPDNVQNEYAAVALRGPCVAARLLDEFAGNLKKGDVILHNAGNGSVGQSLVQLARARGLRPVSVIRSRMSKDERDSIERIKAYGAEAVLLSEYLGTPECNRLMKDWAPITLAIDAVGGQSGADLARELAPGSTLVHMGNASGAGLQLPSSVVIDRDIRVRSFSMDRWLEKASAEEIQSLVTDVLSKADGKQLRCWIETHRFTDFQVALARARSQRNRSVVLNMEK